MRNERRFNVRDLALMERLMLMHQDATQKFLAEVLPRYYDNDHLVIDKDYIVAEGDIPIAVAAHMDTVWEKSVGHEVFYDKKKNVMVNLRGGGYDDKVGIFMILKLLEFGYRPHVIFCADEESGSLGAEALVDAFGGRCPFDDCRFIVMLDRRGLQDCVFYDCENDDFIDYCEGFGFKEAYGSFTDICTLCPAWGMAGVNFSVGYVDEHTANEKLFVGVMWDTLAKVETILSQEIDKIPYFKYVPSRYSFRYTRWNSKYDYTKDFNHIYDYWDYYTNDQLMSAAEDCWYDDDFSNMCWGCSKQLTEEDKAHAVVVVDEHGYPVTYCPDCADEYIATCVVCGERFERDSVTFKDKVCPECKSKMLKNTNKYYQPTEIIVKK